MGKAGSNNALLVAVMNTDKRTVRVYELRAGISKLQSDLETAKTRYEGAQARLATAIHLQEQVDAVYRVEEQRIREIWNARIIAQPSLVSALQLVWSSFTGRDS